MVFGWLVTLVQCCAEAPAASAHHCTGMMNWTNTIQCLGSDHIMSLDVKSFATEGVGTKNVSGNQRPLFFGERLTPVHPLSDQVFKRHGCKAQEFPCCFAHIDVFHIIIIIQQGAVPLSAVGLCLGAIRGDQLFRIQSVKK